MIKSISWFSSIIAINAVILSICLSISSCAVFTGILPFAIWKYISTSSISIPNILLPITSRYVTSIFFIFGGKIRVSCLIKPYRSG